MDTRFECRAYRAGRPLGRIALDAVAGLLEEADTSVWVHLNGPDEALLRRLQPALGLDDRSMETALRPRRRPMVADREGKLVVVLHAAHLEPRNGQVIRVDEMRLLVGRRFVLSMWRDGPTTYARVRSRAETLPAGLAGHPTAVLYGAIDTVIGGYMGIVEDFEVRFERLGQEFTLWREEEATARLYETVQQMLSLRRAAVPLVEVCVRLTHLYEALELPQMSAFFREAQDHTTEVVADIDHLLELYAAAVQVNLSLISVRQNDVIRKFSGWASVFAIPTVVFSLLDFLPELHWRWAYPLVILALLVVCALVYRRFKRSGWL